MNGLKMKIAIPWICCLSLTLLAAACSSGPKPAEPGDSGNASITRQADGSLLVDFGTVTESGSFASVEIGNGLSVGDEDWENDEGLIHLSVVHEGQLHIGACARPGQSNDSVLATITLSGQPARTSASVPTGDSNRLVDLHATGLGNGDYAVSWTEVNRGDYDFNGEANISDIVGIARRLENSYDTSDPEAFLLTEYWVDGNQDGTVSVADISVIGQNYGSQVAGYAISINGSLLDPDLDGFTLTRADSSDRDGLPNLYSTEYTAVVTDSVQIVPRDTGLNDGITTEPEPTSQFSIAVNIDMQLPDTEFYDLDGSGAAGPFSADRFAVAMLEIDKLEPLRRILPGEIPSSAEIGNTVMEGLHAEVFDLPFNRPVALAVAYLPTRDLVTGLPIDPPDGSPVGSFWDLEPEVNVYMLPSGAQPDAQSLGVNLQVRKQELKVLALSTFTGIDGPLGQPLVQELDDQFLSRNTEDATTTFPASFADDVRMEDGKPDQATWGITANLLRRRWLETRSLAFNKADFEMRAKIDVIDSINTAEGWIVARIQSMSIDGVPVPELELPVDSVFLKYTEISEFRKLLQLPSSYENIPPSELFAEQFIDVSGRLHREGGLEGEDIYWIDLLTVPIL